MDAATGSVGGLLSRRRVARSFKLRGLTLQASALDALMNVLSRESNQEETLRALLDASQERLGRHQGSRIVSKELLSDIVVDMSRNSADILDEAVELMDAHETPRLHYNAMHKQFTLVRDEQRSFFGQASDKVNMFVQRYELVRQRILRQDLFRPKLVSADGRQASSDGRNVTHTITPIESLLGRTGVKFLLGLIVQVEEGRYYLEDHTAQVPLDMSEAQILTDGFVTEHCIMLVEGEMVDDVLRVHRMGNPIVETRERSLSVMGHQTNLFSSLSTLRKVQELQQQERLHGPEGMFVILSDVHLDKPIVQDKLSVLLEGYKDWDPLPIFVLMGNFCSTPAHPKTVTGYLDDLAQLIARYPRLAQEGRFVLVPGPLDPGLGEILPRPPLPPSFRTALHQKVRHVRFASNPCRIRYFSKEIVLFRQNTVSQLRRLGLWHHRSGTATAVQHTVKTLLDQGHVCPFPGTPVYWQHDHALRLYPLPDAVVLGDRVSQYHENYAGCDAVNPGRFDKDFSFVVYRPVGDDENDHASDVEFSQVP